MKEIKHFFRTGAVNQHFYLESARKSKGKGGPYRSDISAGTVESTSIHTGSL